MKLSVIMGILHMSIGIVIKGTNSIHFGRYDELFSEVIGGLIILLFLFGWMDLLIVAKWFHSVDIEDTTLVPNPIEGEPDLFKGDLDNQRTPGIINILIVSVFSQGHY
jgi:V-type H+-transporting ATPase subunit a